MVCIYVCPLQMAKDHEESMLAESKKRKEAVESMGEMMNGITERLQDQQRAMEQTCKDNDEMRSQLGRMTEVSFSLYLPDSCASCVII
jgi:hypothetical protein